MLHLEVQGTMPTTTALPQSIIWALSHALRSHWQWAHQPHLMCEALCQQLCCLSSRLGSKPRRFVLQASLEVWHCQFTYSTARKQLRTKFPCPPRVLAKMILCGLRVCPSCGAKHLLPPTFIQTKRASPLCQHLCQPVKMQTSIHSKSIGVSWQFEKSWTASIVPFKLNNSRLQWPKMQPTTSVAALVIYPCDLKTKTTELKVQRWVTCFWAWFA